MAHKLVKYRLNENGTIPDFVLHGHPHDDSTVNKDYDPVVNAQWVWNRLSAVNS